MRKILNNRAAYSDGRQDCLENPCDCSHAGDQMIIIIITASLTDLMKFVGTVVTGGGGYLAQLHVI